MRMLLTPALMYCNVLWSIMTFLRRQPAGFATQTLGCLILTFALCVCDRIMAYYDVF